MQRDATQLKLFTPPPPVQLGLFQPPAPEPRQPFIIRETPAQAELRTMTPKQLRAAVEPPAAPPAAPPADQRWRRWPPPWNKETPADRRIAKQYKPEDTPGMF